VEISSTNGYRLVTRDGTEALLQVAGLSDDPPGIKIRYKVVMRNGESSLAMIPANSTAQSLNERLEAAAGIGSSEERSSAFSRLAHDAANVGNVEVVKQSLPRILDNNARDQATLDAARLLAGRQLRRQAIGIAKTIISSEMRDQALAELAR